MRAYVALMGLYDNETDAAICYAFGRAAGMSPSQRLYGLLSSLHDELRARNLWVELTASMNPDYLRNLTLAVQMDRVGWAQRQRRGKRSDVHV